MFATPAFAITSPCTAPASNTPLNPTYEPPTDASHGCTNGNLLFNNFSAGPLLGSYIVSSPQCGGTTCTIPIGTTTAADTSIFIGVDNAFGIHLASPAASGSTCKSSGVGDGVGFCASEGPGAGSVANVTQITYLESTIDLSSSINFIGMAATLVSHSSGKTGATAIVFEEYCPGAATFSQGCAGGGTLSIGVVQGKFTTITASAGAGFSAVNKVAVRDTIWLATVGAAGEWASMDSADAIAPEPATLGLVGLSLVGLGGLHFRRKKRA